MFHLTSQERKTVIFVLALLVLGIGLDFLNKKTNRANLVNFRISKEQLFDKVDINKATLSELMTIPNLGASAAQAVIDYRKSYSCFKNVGELKQVKGIKDKKLEQIKRYITVESCSK